MIKQVEQNGQQILKTKAGILVASQSELGAWYGVADVDGVLCCECPGFKHRGACKHARAVADLERAERAPKRLVPLAYGEMELRQERQTIEARRLAAVAAVADLFD